MFPKQKKTISFFDQKIKLKFGRYYRDFSQYLNSDLTSGSMLISQNAMPMPKIGINFSYNFKRNKKYSFYGGLAHASFVSAPERPNQLNNLERVLLLPQAL